LKEGLTHIYTGGGKGKTTCSLGLALRAVGHNYNVHIIQFMKSGDTGEMFSIQQYIPNIKFVQFGKDALKEKQLKMVSFEDSEKNENKLKENEVYKFSPIEEEREPARRGLEYARNIMNSENCDMVILDEINCAMAQGIINTEEVLNLLKEKPKHVELILTGRDAPKEIKDAADLVSEIKKIKHPFDKGIGARKGIEY